MVASALWGLIAAAAVAAIGLSVRLRRRRAAVWRRFARRRGLHVVPATKDRPMAVRGKVDGRAFELTLAAQGSDRGELGTEVEEMTLESGVEAPAGLSVEPAPPFEVGGEGASAGDLGHSELESLARIDGEDREALERFLTPVRRQGLMRLLAMEGVDASGLRGSTLFVRARRGVSRIDQLEHDLCVLVSVARQLETSTTTGATSPVRPATP